MLGQCALHKLATLLCTESCSGMSTALIQAITAVPTCMYFGSMQDYPEMFDRPYYTQTWQYNSAMLAAWGSAVKLIIVDLDEYIMMSTPVTLTQAVDRGCLHGIKQARIFR